MVNVIGLGYIGLPTTLMMASHGVEIIGTDLNKELVATLNAAKTTFKEVGLDELFADALKAGVKFTTEYQVTDTYIVSVPTPYDKFSKKVDAKYVVAAVKQILGICPKGATIVIESTVSPGTIDKFIRPVVEESGFKIGKDINSFMLLRELFLEIWFMNFFTTIEPSVLMIEKLARRLRKSMLPSVRARLLLRASVQLR